MDLASLGQVFLIYMLLFVTLGNCAKFKFKVCNVFSNLDGSMTRFNVVLKFLVNVNRRKHPLRFKWEELRQYTH
jgi:hypothetical protein